MKNRDTLKTEHSNEECDCKDNGGQQKEHRKLQNNIIRCKLIILNNLSLIYLVFIVLL